MIATLKLRNVNCLDAGKAKACENAAIGIGWQIEIGAEDVKIAPFAHKILNTQRTNATFWFAVPERGNNLKSSVESYGHMNERPQMDDNDE